MRPCISVFVRNFSFHLITYAVWGVLGEKKLCCWEEYSQCV